MKKPWLGWILILVLIGNALFMILLRKQSTVEPMLPVYQKPYNELVDERIEQQLEVLRPQSLVESLKKLDRMEYYLWPGTIIGASTTLSLDDGGRYQSSSNQQEVILSKRVFRKCLQEISLLPKKEATQLIEKEIKETLPIYLDAYKDFVKSGSISIILSEGEDGKPVLSGLRYKLFALLLISGTCELTSIHETVRQVAMIACLLLGKNRIYRKK